MFILNDILDTLKQDFSDSPQGQKRSVYFVYTLVAVIIPFTTSITSNLLRALVVLFGFDIQSQRFYTFMASTIIPWDKLWHSMWDMIPTPATDGRLMMALDDSINPKTGKKIYGCGYFHNHASKKNQTSYPWSQCILALGLLKQVKGRWVCIPLAFCFYIMQKVIAEKKINAQHRGKTVKFASKMEQAAAMIKGVQAHYKISVLIVTDSWFGNDGLWSKLNRGNDGDFDLLSRLRKDIILYDFPVIEKGRKKKRGRKKKYGTRHGNADHCAGFFREKAQEYSVFLYGKKRTVQAYSQTFMLKTLKCQVHIVWIYRKSKYVALFTTDLSLSVEQIIEYYGARWKIESGFKEIKQEIGSAKSQTRDAQAVTNHLHFCMMATTLTWIYAARLQNTPDRRHKIKGRASFAFSDVRKIIAEAALDPGFQSICPKPTQTSQKSFINALLRMVA